MLWIAIWITLCLGYELWTTGDSPEDLARYRRLRNRKTYTIDEIAYAFREGMKPVMDSFFQPSFLLLSLLKPAIKGLTMNGLFFLGTCSECKYPLYLEILTGRMYCQRSDCLNYRHEAICHPSHP